MSRKSDLPFGSEFSPNVVDLPFLLQAAKETCGDGEAFEEAVRTCYFDSHKDTDDYNRNTLAYNTKRSMIAYGIIDEETCLTDFGNSLYIQKDDDIALYDIFARHILLKLYGITAIQCIQDMQAAGAQINLRSLRKELVDRGVYFPRGGKHFSTMRLWLEKAGVFDHGYLVNREKYEILAGLATKDIEALAMFTPEQKAYLKTLANLGITEPQTASEIEKLASATYGVQFNEKNLPKSVLYPLEEAGYIELERGTSGRGAKSAKVATTEKFVANIVAPIIEQLEQQNHPDLRPFLREPLENIIASLDDKDKYKAGLALEALAIKLMRLIDLQYVATRLRGSATGGAEVDVIFESSRLVYSRWQVQCKNTLRVSLDNVAKEVGLTHFLHSNAVVIVTTGRIGTQARRYANTIMKESNLAIVMIDGNDIEMIKDTPTSILKVLDREAEHAMRLKTLDLES